MENRSFRGAAFAKDPHALGVGLAIVDLHGQIEILRKLDMHAEGLFLRRSPSGGGPIKIQAGLTDGDDVGADGQRRDLGHGVLQRKVAVPRIEAVGHAVRRLFSYSAVKGRLIGVDADRRGQARPTLSECDGRLKGRNVAAAGDGPANARCLHSGDMPGNAPLAVLAGAFLDPRRDVEGQRRIVPVSANRQVGVIVDDGRSQALGHIRIGSPLLAIAAHESYASIPKRSSSSATTASSSFANTGVGFATGVPGATSLGAQGRTDE